MAIKIAVANQKGGVGKTTTSICLAQILKTKGYRVLFIDSDAQCNSTGFFEAQVTNQATFMDILCDDTPAQECIQHTKKGDIIASDPLISNAENVVRVDERRFSHLKRACLKIEKEYDFIVIDTPPAIGVALKNVLAYVDYIIIPVEESGWSMTGLMDFAKAIDLAKDNNVNLSVLGILVVKAKDRTKKAARMEQLAKSIAEQLETTVFETKIRESVACAEALTEFFVPLNEYAPNSTTNQDYERFVDELLQKFESED